MSLIQPAVGETLDFSHELTRAAHVRLGAPFLLHESVSSCGKGETISTCMERGMDASGYDCSGFGIACTADVLGRNAYDIEPHLRHVRQLDALADKETGQRRQLFDEGYFIILYVTRQWRMNPQLAQPIHLGLVTGRNTMINAHPNPAKVVSQSIITKKKPIRDVSLLAASVLAERGWR